MNKKSNASSMAKNTLLLMIISAVGLLLSFVKEAIVAYYFGASETMDAYVVAVDLPVTLFSLLSVALSVVFIPNYIKIRTDLGIQPANRFFCNLFTVLALVCGGFALVLELAADVFVHISAPGLTENAHALAVQLFRITIPTAVVLMLVHANNGVMNSHKSFALPALGEPILSVVFIVLVAWLAVKYGIYAAVVGTLAGALVELVYSSVLRRKYAKYRPFIDLKDPYVKKSIGMAGPVFLGTSITEINKLIDKAIASALSAGSISALHYASKISTGISSLLISGLSTVFYPEFAERAAKKDDEGMAQIYDTAVNCLLLLIIPLVFGGFFLQREIVSIAYGRGAFDAAALSLTAPLFAGYLVSLFFTSVQMFSTKVYNAYGETKVPVICSSVGVLINIVLNLILSKFFGAAGLVAATVISSAVTAVILMVTLKRKNPCIDFRHMRALLFKGILAAVLMTCVLLGVKYLMGLVMGDITKGLSMVVYVIVAVAVGAVAYAAGLWVLRVAEFRQIIGMLKKK